MKKQNKPAPCPFCRGGNLGYAEVHSREFGQQSVVECLTCGASGPRGKDEAHAIGLWAFRPARERRATHVTSSVVQP